MTSTIRDRFLSPNMDTSYQRGADVLIRNARPGDLTEIYDILTLEGKTDCQTPPVEDLLRDGFDTPPWFNMVVAERGCVVGVMVYCRAYWPRPAPAGRVVSLRALAVRGSARRCGVGTKLFRELCRIAQAENAQLNWSHCPKDTVAVAFFAQFRPDVSEDLDGTYFLRVYPRKVEEIAGTIGSNTDVTVELARKEDMVELKNMIHEISVIRGTANDPHLDVKDLIADGFASPPWFFAQLARRGADVVGGVVGHGRYNWARSVHMLGLYVRPSARGLGLAKRLIHEFCRKVEEDGATYVDFNVLHPENKEASALYQRFGAERLRMWDHHVSYRLEIYRNNDVLTQI